MANAFDKIIDDFLKLNGGIDNDIVQAVRKLRDEAGDVDELTAYVMIHKLIDGMIKGLTGSDTAAPDAHVEDAVDFADEARQLYEENVEAVREYLDAEGYSYDEDTVRSRSAVFEVGFSDFAIKITVEADINVCGITAFFPVAADKMYEYPVAHIMAKLNYQFRYGTFKYDERDGEITYDYSFSAAHGIDYEDLDVYFNTIGNIAKDYYGEIHKYSVGKIRKGESEQILSLIRKLKDDLAA